MNVDIKQKWIINERCKPIDQWNIEFKNYLTDIILNTLDTPIEEYKQYVEIYKVDVDGSDIIIDCMSRGEDYKLLVKYSTYLSDNWKEYLEIDVCNKTIEAYNERIHYMEGQMNFDKMVINEYQRKLRLAESRLKDHK